MAFENEKIQILANVKLWQKVKEINIKYIPYKFDAVKGKMIKNYDKRTSKAKYGKSWYRGSFVWGGTFDFKEFLTGKIFEEMEFYDSIVDEYRDVWEIWREYEKEILEVFESKKLYKAINNCPPDNRGVLSKIFRASTENRFYELQNYERDYLDRITYSPVFPTVQLHLSAVTQYDTYSRSITYSFKDILECYDAAKEKEGKLTFVKRQRAKMSDDLRFNVLKRDGYRCKICGATVNDGIKLEVDHIVPVSKGGKTTIENLQTLCERCNRGKRTKEM